MFESDLQKLKELLALCKAEPNRHSYNKLHEYKFFAAGDAFVRYVCNYEGLYVYLWTKGSYHTSEYTQGHEWENILTITHRVIADYITYQKNSLEIWQTTFEGILSLENEDN